MGIKNVSRRQEQAFPCLQVFCLQVFISEDFQSQKVLCAYLRSSILFLQHNVVEPISQIIQRNTKQNCWQVNALLNAPLQKITCSYTEEDDLPCLPVNAAVEMLLIFWTQHPSLQLIHHTIFIPLRLYQHAKYSVKA